MNRNTFARTSLQMTMPWEAKGYSIAGDIYPWIGRALRTGDEDNILNPDGSHSTIKTATGTTPYGAVLFPTIRRMNGSLRHLPISQAIDITKRNEDAMEFSSVKEANDFAKRLSSYLGKPKFNMSSTPDRFKSYPTQPVKAVDPSFASYGIGSPSTIKPITQQDIDLDRAIRIGSAARDWTGSLGDMLAPAVAPAGYNESVQAHRGYQDSQRDWGQRNLNNLKSVPTDLVGMMTLGAPGYFAGGELGRIAEEKGGYQNILDGDWKRNTLDLGRVGLMGAFGKILERMGGNTEYLNPARHLYGSAENAVKPFLSDVAKNYIKGTGLAVLDTTPITAAHQALISAQQPHPFFSGQTLDEVGNATLRHLTDSPATFAAYGLPRTVLGIGRSIPEFSGLKKVNRLKSAITKGEFPDYSGVKYGNDVKMKMPDGSYDYPLDYTLKVADAFLNRSKPVKNTFKPKQVGIVRDFEKSPAMDKMIGNLSLFKQPIVEPKALSVPDPFTVERDDERTIISLANKGSGSYTESYPKYEFSEDLTDDDFNKLGIDEDELITKIDDLSVNEDELNKGNGRKIMDRIIDDVIKNGNDFVYLNASPMGSKGLNLNDLTDFYKDYGFKVLINQGGNNQMYATKEDLINRMNEKRALPEPAKPIEQQTHEPVTMPKQPWEMTKREWDNIVKGRAKISGLPENADLSRIQYVNNLNGRHNLKVESKEDKGFYGHGYNIKMLSPPTPTVITSVKYDEADKHKAYPRIKAYDSSIVDKDGNIINKDYKERNDLLRHKGEKGYIYRGMSAPEFEAGIRTGLFKSKGEYNFDHQGDVTFFADNPAQAASYASTFTPVGQEPSFEQPGYVIRIKRPSNAKENGVNEIAVPNEINASDIDKVYEIRLATEQPGKVEFITAEGHYGIPDEFNILTEGSRYSPAQTHVARELPKSEWGLSYHKRSVKDALNKNLPIPPEVLADYPDLQSPQEPPEPEPAVVRPPLYHGLGRPSFEGEKLHNKYGDAIYLTDDYNISKHFANAGTEFGGDFSEDVTTPPFVVNVRLKDGSQIQKLVPYNAIESIYSDATFENDKSVLDGYSFENTPSGQIFGEDNFPLNKEEFERYLRISPDEVDAVEFKKRKLDEKIFDEYGVGKFNIRPDAKMEVIDADGSTWGSDIQAKINKVKASGVDGIIIKNIIEGGVATPADNPSTTTVIFNPDVIDLYNQRATPQIDEPTPAEHLAAIDAIQSMVTELDKPISLTGVIEHFKKHSMPPLGRPIFGSDKHRQEEWNKFTPEEQQAEFKRKAIEDLNVASKEAEASGNPANYLLDRALDPLDPMSEMYKVILQKMGATITDKGIKLPKIDAPAPTEAIQQAGEFFDKELNTIDKRTVFGGDRARAIDMLTNTPEGKIGGRFAKILDRYNKYVEANKIPEVSNQEDLQTEIEKRMPPIPETWQSILAQVEKMKQGYKDAVLITPGAPVPAVYGTRKLKTDIGTLVYVPDMSSPAKAIAKEKELLDAANAGKIGKLLGMSVETKPEPNPNNLVVQTLDANGNEIMTEITTPENLENAIEAGNKMAGTDGQVVNLGTVEEALPKIIELRQPKEPVTIQEHERLLKFNGVQPKNYNMLTIEQADKITPAIISIQDKYGHRWEIADVTSSRRGNRQAESNADTLTIYQQRVSEFTDYGMYQKNIEKKIAELEKILSDPEFKPVEKYDTIWDKEDIEWKLKNYKESLKYKRWTVPDSYKSVGLIVAHEYGHLLVGNTPYAVTKNIMEDTYKKAKETGFIHNISEYGGMNSPEEFFAECFAMREANEEIPEYINNMLEEVIENVNK